MAIPYPTDPSLPSNPAPLFSDSTAARGDHLRANNAEIWANFTEIVGTILGNASISTDGTFAANSDSLFASQKALVTYINARLDALVPIGTSFEYSGLQANIPASFMIESGANLLRADYPDCFSKLSEVIGTVTISIASPGVVTYNSHPFQTGDCIHLTTSGALPTGLSVDTNYYVIVNDGNTFWLATTYANALADTKINTSDTQSGAHTLTWIPWGAADGTHFYLPDTQGLSTEGSGQLTTNGAAWGSVNYKGRLGQYKQDQFQATAIQATRTSATVGGGFTGIIAYGNSATYNNVLMELTQVSDGTHGTPRTGYITAGPRVGKYKIIKVM